jgi:predicted ATPase
MATKGWSTPDVELAYRRARELCQQIGESPQLFPVLWGLWGFYAVRGELHSARELGEQCLHLAQRVQDRTFLAGAYYGIGVTSFWQGDPVSAHQYLEKSAACYETEQHNLHASLYGVDLGVGSHIYGAWAVAILGYFDQALRQSEEALVLAQKLNHSQSSIYALAIAVVLRSYDGEWQRAQEQAETIIALSERHGSVFTLALGIMTKGWVLAERGQEEVGRSLIHQGLAAAHDTGDELTRTYYLARLASVCEKSGQTEEGLAAVAEALASVDKTGERAYEAELYRLKGELTLQKEARDWRLGTGSPSPQTLRLKLLAPMEVVEQAERYFLKAIDISRKQQAKSLELRAVMSLARLWQQQSKTAEAHKMLSEIYNWFTEGFDTKDLQEAKALLESLEGKDIAET